MKRKLPAVVTIALIGALATFVYSCANVVDKKSYSATLGPAASPKSLSTEDLHFLYSLHSLALYNLALAKEGDIRGTASETVALAAAVVESATDTHGKILDLAAEYQLAIASDMTAEQKNKWKELVKKRGWDFDKAFASQMQTNLRQCQILYNDIAASCKNEPLRKIAALGIKDILHQEELSIAQQQVISDRTGKPTSEKNEIARR